MSRQAMSQSAMSQIVVGVDSSPGAARALEWAIAEAGRRGADVRAVFACARDGRPSLHEAVAAVAGGQTAVKVAERIVYDDAFDALLAESAGAAMLVVGAREIGPLRQVLAGSFSAICAHEATVPVVVVNGAGRAPSDDRRPVLVGVDGSPSSLVALRWAAAEARLADVDLRVVCAWEPSQAGSAGDETASDTTARRAAEDRLNRAVADVLGGSPQVRVHTDLVRGPAAVALAEAANSARLLVVGARGDGEFPGPLFGSTSDQCVLHAPGPVAVIHAPRAG
jgi:nucleotide-binding universal stress UspA family protein